MPLILPYGDKVPQIAPDAYVAPNATLIGDVTIEEGASVWFGAVLRGDDAAIRIGPRSNVQDNAVIHADIGLPTIVGADVTIGHSAIVHSARIGDGALIGMGAIVLQRARVGARSVLAAGAVLGEGKEVAAGMLAAGVPAVEKKPLSGSAQAWTETAAAEYQRYRERYLTTAVVIEGS